MSEQLNETLREENSPGGHGNRSFERFRVADWTVDPASNQVLRGEQAVSLAPKVMEVLIYLANRPGEVVTREELEATVWAGTIVGYDSVTSAIQKLRKAFDDDPKQPRIIETLSKRGYRLVAPVHPPDESAETARALSAAIESAQPRNQWINTRRVVLLTLLATAFGSLLWVSPWQTTNNTVVRESMPKSIAVLPFANMSGDSQQEYFVDGITEDIITDLSSLSDLVVIARNTSFSYKGGEAQAQKVGKDLGVLYVLEGSVRKSGDRLRITAQLIDTGNGNHIWAERYDRKLVEIFSLQDEVTQNIVSALAITLTTQEKELLARPATNNFEAYDFFLQGQQNFRQRTREGNDLARDAYRSAIKSDPTYARAYGALAIVLTFDYRRGWTELSLDEARTRALELAQKAVALDRSSPQVYWAQGFVYLFRKQFKEASTAVEQAVARSPNYADGYALLAFISNWQGNAEEAINYIEKAISLNPHHTFEYPWNLGLANYTLGRYMEAVEALQEALERNEQVFLPRLYLAASYVRLGQQDDAEWEIEQVKIQYPAARLSRMANILPYEKEDQMNAFLEDLRKAGFPE